METQKIGNLLNDTDNLQVINGHNNIQYGNGDENGSTIKFETKFIKPSLLDYSHAYVLVTGDITVVDVAAITNVAFKNCAPFRRYVTHINDEHVETAENLDIIMPMYNLLEYLNSPSFKYKANLLGKANVTDGNNRSLKNVKVVVPLKYLCNFFKSLEMPLIN